MARKVFFSFHYQRDAMRVSQIRKMGALEGQPILTSNKWEEVERQGKASIQRWIDNQMRDKSCVIVLIGSDTAGREWVDYEIRKAWRDGKGLLGIYIHKLVDPNQYWSPKGANPFTKFPFAGNVSVYDPPGITSSQVYRHINNNIESWVETAIKARQFRL